MCDLSERFNIECTSVNILHNSLASCLFTNLFLAILFFIYLIFLSSILTITFCSESKVGLKIFK